ncbi:hypothetical protein O9929_20460 [Vibrio lentus]|nr:hypothetical protein [Vibrio lentus]
MVRQSARIVEVDEAKGAESHKQSMAIQVQAEAIPMYRAPRPHYGNNIRQMVLCQLGSGKRV